MRKPAASIKDSITVSLPERDGSTKKCPSQSGTVYEQSVSAKVRRSPRWHSKAPASVSLNTSLSDAAFRVYCVLGLNRNGAECGTGVRYLGRLLNKSKSNIKRKMDELVAANYLELIPTGNGQRGRYRFTSPAFQQKCKHCKRLTDQIRENGLCWVCDEEPKRAFRVA
jgi:DNA-binding MarR family transcriptional regulator